MNFRALTEAILEWYRSRKRDLPWRHTRDPYHIWVSEIMLQQTQVDVVIPYYTKFLSQYPDMASLAAASDDEMLGAWQGLGYYSRVRNLRQGVREVLETYGGKIPDQPEQIRALPGIGPYTAGAILSIAYNKRETAVDGNVLRVISRLCNIRETVEQSQVRRKITTIVQKMLPESEPGEFNQALMELGALVCIPKSAKCEECPWVNFCEARFSGSQNLLPIRRKIVRQKIIRVWAGFFCIQGKVLVRRRPAKGILAGMWELPSVEDMADAKEDDLFEALQSVFERHGQKVSFQRKWLEITHVFSHREWHLSVWTCTGENSDGDVLPDGCQWISADEAWSLNWAGPYRKVVEAWIKDKKEVEG